MDGMINLLSSDEARKLVDQLTIRILDDERLYKNEAVKESHHILVAGVIHVYWSRPKALGECAALQQIIEEYVRLRDVFDPVDEQVRAGANLGVMDRAGWERNKLQLMGLEFALRALAGAPGVMQ